MFKKIFFIIVALISFTIILTTVQVYIDSDINHFVIEDVQAQSSCTTTCLTGLEKTSGPDGTFKRICEGFCECKFVWVAYDDDFGTGSCSGTSSDVEEN